MKAHLQNTYESPVYQVQSTPSTEDDKKLYELSVRMKQLATEVKTVNSSTKLNRMLKAGDELADTVLEFLKVAGWSPIVRTCYVSPGKRQRSN